MRALAFLALTAVATAQTGINPLSGKPYFSAPVFSPAAAPQAQAQAAPPAASPASSPTAPAQPAPTATAAPTSSAPGVTPQSSFLGKDMPFFDPGTNLLTWDGKSWNVTNNQLFAARFEKYLNAPEATTLEDRQYQAIINEVLARLAPGQATREQIDYAFRLLMRGSNYDIDARLCDALADAIYTVWTAQRQQQRLLSANKAMEWDIIVLEKETRMSPRAAQAARAAEMNSANRQPQGQASNRQSRGQQQQQQPNQPPQPNQPQPNQIPPIVIQIPGLPTPPPNQAQQQTEDNKLAALEAGGYKERRLAEMIARQKANDIKRELSEIQAKVEYQALIVQFFVQRRFQHVLMATRFYRAIFADGDAKLNVSDEQRQLFTKGTGFSPTVSTLDSLANEAIRDVREGVKAFDFLLEKNELRSASERLAEAFTVGEYLPEIRTLSRDKKRKCVAFVQKSNELLAKMEVKDFGGAEKVIAELAPLAKDFDASKPQALIETARQASRLHLAKARNAALSGDKDVLEKEIRAAAELWPLNPELAQMSQKIFDQGDVQQQALNDLDQLIAQKNYRRIYEDSARFIAASAQYPDRQKQLTGVLENMKKIEAATLRAEEMRRQGNYPGAWESVEKAAADFPDDVKLSQLRADLTTQAADFVRTLRAGQDLEKRDQLGASLSHFLKAQKLYPASDYAQEGIERVKKLVLPAN